MASPAAMVRGSGDAPRLKSTMSVIRVLRWGRTRLPMPPTASANPGSTTLSKRDLASSVVWALPQSARDAAHRAAPTMRSACSRMTSRSSAENPLVFPWIRPDSCLRQRRKHESVNAIR